MAQKGFEYEENAYNALHLQKGTLGLDVSTGGTAGASADKPDLTIQRKGIPGPWAGGKGHGVELKISPTAAGSLVMKYVVSKRAGRTGEWIYGSIKKSGDGNAVHAEKAFIQGVGIENNLLQEMNTSGNHGKNWRKHKPALRVNPDGSKCFGPGCDNVRDAYNLDIKHFGGPNEVKIMMNNASAVSEYYNRKKCYYINVGTHGFFLLGNRDPLKLNKAMRDLGYTKVIPDFGASAKCMIRVRVHDKSRSGPSGESFFEGAEDRVGGYQFTMTLQFSNVTKSPYNIAPLVAGSKSQIDLKRLKADKLLCAWL